MDVWRDGGMGKEEGGALSTAPPSVEHLLPSVEQTFNNVKHRIAAGHKTAVNDEPECLARQTC